MDIIRKIVLAVKDATGPVSAVDGLSRETFAHHAQLLEEAGLVTAAIQGGGKKISEMAVIYRLTWAGSDFADSIKSETLWQKAKDNVMKPTASWTFGVLLKYLEVEITGKVPGLDHLF
jgi:DNA-binding transcriptional ArsR family regulator